MLESEKESQRIGSAESESESPHLLKLTQDAGLLYLSKGKFDDAVHLLQKSVEGFLLPCSRYN